VQFYVEGGSGLLGRQAESVISRQTQAELIAFGSRFRASTGRRFGLVPICLHQLSHLRASGCNDEQLHRILIECSHIVG